MIKLNREAARRCRERRKTYIEYLEQNVKDLEKKNKELKVFNFLNMWIRKKIKIKLIEIFQINLFFLS